MINKKSKGFTIIELLVVVAIIAVLAAIVLVNVTGYINKGKNAAIKGNLATILTNAAVFYDEEGDYNGFGPVGVNPYSDGYKNPETAIASANPVPNNPLYGEKTDDSLQWCACATLKPVTGDDVAYCVDFKGTKIGKTVCDTTVCSQGTAVTDGICKGA